MIGVRHVDEQHDQALHHLAQRLHAWHLAGVASFLFSMGQGTSIVASHVLLFAQPFMPFANLRHSLKLYAVALEDEQSWQALMKHLSALES